MFKSSSFSLVLAAALFCGGVSAQGPVASISSAQSSKCLQVRGSKFHDGTAVETFNCNNSRGQQWENFSGLTEIIVENLGKRFCLDAKTVDRPSEVVIWECNNKPWQQWIFTDDGLITLAQNTSSFSEASLLSLPITETCFFIIKTYALRLLNPSLAVLNPSLAMVYR
ncbi:ricin B lectin domain-containing protein [Mycena capillaripes]|nr:ricin B lectin domain-containing protein [Mycena capillaripes]